MENTNQPNTYLVQVGHTTTKVPDLQSSLSGNRFDGGLVYHGNRCIGAVEGCDFVPNIPDVINVKPLGGEALTAEEAAHALEEAMKIIYLVGTTGVDRAVRPRNNWMKRYFPHQDF